MSEIKWNKTGECCESVSESDDVDMYEHVGGKLVSF